MLRLGGTSSVTSGILLFHCHRWSQGYLFLGISRNLEMLGFCKGQRKGTKSGKGRGICV